MDMGSLEVPIPKLPKDQKIPHRNVRNLQAPQAFSPKVAPMTVSWGGFERWRGKLLYFRIVSYAMVSLGRPLLERGLRIGVRSRKVLPCNVNAESVVDVSFCSCYPFLAEELLTIRRPRVILAMYTATSILKLILAGVVPFIELLHKA